MTAAATVLATALPAVAGTSPGLAAASPARTQELVELTQGHTVFARPDATATPVDSVSERRPLTHERTTLPVVGRRDDLDGRPWLHVQLPGRPNGRTAWIRERSTRVSQTSWHIVVSTGRRLMTVYRNGDSVRRVTVVVGKPSTPTPHGTFFVEEVITLGATAVGAPYALALSARSTVLQEFAGGPGQIALHGLGNVGGVPGTAVSHGCVRIDNATVSWLVRHVGPGAPVTITR